MLIRGQNNKQQGAALVAGIILLLIAAIGALSISQMSLFDELSTRNQRDVALANAASDIALREAEQWLDEQTLLPEEQDISCLTASPACAKPIVFNDAVGGLLNCAAVNTLAETNWTDWASSSVTRQTATSGIQEIKQKSEYLIREADFLPDTLTVGEGVQPGRYVYEISARGASWTDQAPVILQSTYIRRY